MTSTRTAHSQPGALQHRAAHAEVPPERLPIPPTPVNPPGQRPPGEIDPGSPPEIVDPVLPGENAPVVDPQRPATVHSLG